MPNGTRSLSRNNRRILFAVLAVAVAIVFGGIGYYLIEGWSIVDSLYVSAQTVTTVGYGDLTPATRNGRLFSTVFMLAGVGIVLYALTTTVQAIVQSELVATFGQRRLSRKMSKLRNHFIVCGAGRVGSHLIRSLLGSAETFIVIERDPQKVAELVELGVIVLVRDATLEESLLEAGVAHARGLAACLADDADNVYVVLTARDLNPRMHIVARAAEEQAEPKLIRAGANRVVAP
ncbi:MAG TPA: potassium channel family protein, partial [Pyrinomonadaceae bacterium]|nr:potassium channel family protein [Pyrinomonadaceae bacterium]